jgi:hypothetical protein
MIISGEQGEIWREVVVVCLKVDSIITTVSSYIDIYRVIQLEEASKE